MRTATGYAVLGDNGPLSVPQYASILIGQDGSISIVPPGQTPQTMATTGRIKLVNPPSDALERCWQEGVRVAAIAHAMAKECRRVRADEALLAGPLHNIGKVYILARTPRQAAISAPFDEAVLRDWHPGIGQALIENWKLPEEIAIAVGGQLDLQRSHSGPPDLQDLTIVAVNVASQMANNAADDAALAKISSAAALGLTHSALVRIMLESQTELEMLQAALG